MPTLKNAHTGDLILPDGIAIRRNGPAVTLADDVWSKALAHPVVKAWVDEGKIVVESAASSRKQAEPVRMAADPDPAPVEDEADPRDELRGKARSLGIEVDMRWGEKRLREEIDKALAE